jgi:hypothetical protein
MLIDNKPLGVDHPQFDACEVLQVVAAEPGAG